MKGQGHHRNKVSLPELLCRGPQYSARLAIYVLELRFGLRETICRRLGGRKTSIPV